MRGCFQVVLLVLGVLGGAVGCGSRGAQGLPGAAGAGGLTALLATATEPPGIHCLQGGLAVKTGIDQDRNGVLDDAEVTSTAFVCNAVAPLVQASREGPGGHCAQGGLLVQTGIDADHDGALSVAEVASTTWVCDSVVASGMTLVATVDEPAGANCTYGGTAVHAGLDLNNNSVLDPDEVTTTAYVCTGAPGSAGGPGPAGPAALVSTATEPAGPNCTFGGVAVSTGTDTDGDGALAPGEVQSTVYVCTPPPMLIATDRFTLDPNSFCPGAGLAIRHGVDLDGDGLLSPDEVKGATDYVCDGAPGLASLVEVSATQSPDLLVECPTGGVEIDSGLDLNSDGILNGGEVTTTAYLCNGPAGVGVAFEAVQLSVDDAACPYGGWEYTFAQDENNNGFIDPFEPILATTAVCNGAPAPVLP